MNNYLFWKRFAQGKLRTHVSSVKIRIPSPKEILSWSERRLSNSTLVGKLDNAHTVEHDTLKPVSGGLFCERIFGPIATNVCACLRRKGWNEDYCKICEVQFTKSRLRRYQMGHILLAAPIIHIWALQGGYLANLLGKKNLGIRSIAHGKVMCQSKLWKSQANNQIIKFSYDSAYRPKVANFALPSVRTAKLNKRFKKAKLNNKDTYDFVNSYTYRTHKINLPSLRTARKAGSQKINKKFLPTVRTLVYKEEHKKTKNQIQKIYERGNVLPFHQFLLYKPDTFNKITQFFNSLSKEERLFPLPHYSKQKLIFYYTFGRGALHTAEAWGRRAHFGSIEGKLGITAYRKGENKIARLCVPLQAKLLLRILPSVRLVGHPKSNQEAYQFMLPLDAWQHHDYLTLPSTFYTKKQQFKLTKDNFYKLEGVFKDRSAYHTHRKMENVVLQKNKKIEKKGLGHKINYSMQSIVGRSINSFISQMKLRSATGHPTRSEARFGSTLRPTFYASQQLVCNSNLRCAVRPTFGQVGTNLTKGRMRSKSFARKEACLSFIEGKKALTNQRFVNYERSSSKITSGHSAIQVNQKDTIRNFGVFSRSDTLSWGIFYFYDKYNFESLSNLAVRIASYKNKKNKRQFATHLVYSAFGDQFHKEKIGLIRNQLYFKIPPASYFLDKSSFLGRNVAKLQPKVVTESYLTEGRLNKEARPKISTAPKVSTAYRAPQVTSQPINYVSRYAKPLNYHGRGVFDINRTPKENLSMNLKIFKKNKPTASKLIDIKNITYTGSSVLFQSLKNLNLPLLDSLISWKWQKSKIELNKFLLQNKLRKKKRNLRNRIAKTKIILTKRKNLVQSFLSTSQLPEWMIISILPVLPPALRPILELEPNNVVVSDLNVLYQTVIRRNDALMGLLTFRALEIDILNRQVSLQQAIEKLFDKGAGTKKRPVKSLSQGFHGKKGLFRSHLLGKRVDYSGRSVIVVGPQLKLYECGLPKEMALVLFLPFLIARLKKRKVVTNTSQAKQLIFHKDKQIWSHLKALIYEHPVLLNRAPTLHRLGFQAFQPILVSGKAMILPALVCTGFNADFDGDQMAVHVPLSHAARAESWKLLHAKNNMLSPATGKPIVVLSQEMILGCYCSSLILNKTHLLRNRTYRLASLQTAMSEARPKVSTAPKVSTYLTEGRSYRAPKVNSLFSLSSTRSSLRTALPSVLDARQRPEAQKLDRRLVSHQRLVPQTTASEARPEVSQALVLHPTFSQVNSLEPRLSVKRYFQSTSFAPSSELKLHSWLLGIPRKNLKLCNNLYFTTFQEIYKALGSNKITIQTAVWLRIPYFEDNQFLEEPLEIRLDAKGHFFRSYCQSQRHFSKNIKSKDQIKGLSYIRTSAGRIQLNETFYSSWSD